MANILVKATDIVNFQNVHIQREIRVTLASQLSLEPTKYGF
jgi:hypothetical protein